VAEGLHGFIEGCDIAGYCSNQFDVPLLAAEFRRCGIELDYASINLIDVGNIYKRLNPRTLSDAYESYTGMKLSDAHSAEADIKATHDVLKQIFIAHPELSRDMTELALWSNHDKPILDLSGKFTTNTDGVIVYNFGKNKNIPVTQDMEYLNWMLNGDFARDTKKIGYQIWGQYYNNVANSGGEIGALIGGAVRDIFKGK
jgi:DNA polymerase-3 subunit epsilon